MNLHAAPIQRFGADGQEKLPPLRAAIEGGAAGAERPPRAAAAPRCRGSRRRACGQGLAAMAEGVSPAPRRGQGNASFPVSARALSALSKPEKTRSEEHTSELQSLMRISYAVFCCKKKNNLQEISRTQLP